ncbi:hypothetical protein POM88_037904 [Heracleum sosnowskyi]|uniref:Uncharacterized protein n=1 Tax=Heracleum sosnowskyi TaxID=360622 RepID=A0AAD8HQZ7_9APIA|nr:hypothetical protein POM88_037904 [Heracleum sosnowskyi]
MTIFLIHYERQYSLVHLLLRVSLVPLLLSCLSTLISVLQSTNVAESFEVGVLGMSNLSKPRFYSVRTSVRKRSGSYKFRGNAGRSVKWPRFCSNRIVEDEEGEGFLGL